jgi:acyl-CoA reductase-like NAD-dependent aldehyde dehydrogenase
MTQVTPFWVAGTSRTSSGVHQVHSPYDGSVVGRHAQPTPADVDEAVAAAVAVQPEALATTAAQRAEALMHVSTQIAARAEEIAQVITAENGKPLLWARAEVGRGVSTFRWAAEEARRWSGELQRLDTDASAAGRMALIRRFPNGPVLGIAPFNFPLNLVAHKVAPALAVGAPIIIKPAPATPLTALLLGEILSGTDLPAGMWSVLPLDNEQTARLVADPRLPVVSFTGSETVGYSIQSSQPTKHVVLELGGNAAAVVMPDWSSDADLDWATTRIATFGNYQAGQSCISVQRVFVDETLYDRFVPLLVDKMNALRTGPPTEEGVVVGPVINEAAAERIGSWVEDAVASGAQVLAGGTREGTTIAPTLLANAPAEAKVSCEEVFGPVMTVAPVSGVDGALAAVNDSRFGLQAGLFTHDVQVAFRAHRELLVGGVVIGDVPSFRADQMPYGGVKSSGLGREGLRSAMTDFTHDRVMVLTGLDL